MTNIVNSKVIYINSKITSIDKGLNFVKNHSFKQKFNTQAPKLSKSMSV